mgnify:CR=1 FL=1
MNSNLPETSDLHSITEQDDEGLSFDEAYISFYLAKRKKADAYRKACKATGWPVPEKYVGQYANKYHKRLNASGAIDKALQAMILDDKIAGRIELNNLRDNSESENIRFQTAKLQAGDLYTQESASAGVSVTINRDNVEITHKNQTLTVKDKD